MRLMVIISLLFATMAIPAVLADSPTAPEDCETKYDHFGDFGFCINPCSVTPTCMEPKVDVNTNNGHSGLICSCPIYGPPFLCCKLAYVADMGNGQSGWELVGNCKPAETCGEGGCQLYTLYDEAHDPISSFGVCEQ